MLNMDDIIKNMEGEQEYIEYDYDLNDICNEYKEKDLILYETDLKTKNTIIFLPDLEENFIYIKKYTMSIIKMLKNYLINIICHLKMMFLMNPLCMDIGLQLQKRCLSE